MHEQKFETLHPGLFIFLVDQSLSMEDPFGLGGSSMSKADAVASAVNSVLDELALAATKKGGPKHYFDIAVIGYGATVASAFSPPLSHSDLVSVTDLHAHQTTEPMTIIDREGVETTRNAPVWITPVASNGTPMADALDRAATLAEGWLPEHRESHPPIVLNVTDGEANIGGDPAVRAEELTKLATDDGPALLFNLHLSSTPSESVFFPGSCTNLPDEFATKLCQMSSDLPSKMVDAAQAKGYDMAQQGSRGFIFNGKASDLVNFLDIGTGDKSDFR